MAQPKVKAKTLQQKMGFVDVDLRTPQHDAIMVWLDQELGNIMRKKHGREWNQSEIDRATGIMRSWIDNAKKRTQQDLNEHLAFEALPESAKRAKIDRSRYTDERKQWLLDALAEAERYTPGDIPARKLWLASKVWEYPISSRKDYIVGFIDMKVIVGYEVELTVTENRDRRILLPVWDTNEATETYLFEVKPTIPSVGELIRQVRLYQEYERGHYVVVSPDDRFASIIESQGIEFLKVELNQ